MLRFKCPDCDHDVLEEVMVNVTVSSLIGEIRQYNPDYPDMTYLEQANDGGEIDRYQCPACGYVVKDGGEAGPLAAGGVVIQGPRELIKWVEEHCGD